MRKAIFFMHSGACFSSVVRTYLQQFLGDDDWYFSTHEEGPNRYAIRDNNFKAEPRVDFMYQQFSNSIKGTIETQDAFIKNYSQQMAIRFKEELKLVHFVCDPISVASSLDGLEAYGGPVLAREIEEGSHIKRDPEWTTFQHCLWEWADCHIKAMLMTQQIGPDNVFMLPYHKLTDGGLQSLVEWIEGVPRPEGTEYKIHAEFPVFTANPQQRVDSFTWFNGLRDMEKRMVVMLFKHLMKNKLLAEAPEFIKPHLAG
jgi:hypothetical protein